MRHLFVKRVAKSLPIQCGWLLMAILLAFRTVSAAELTDLYQADVDAAGSASQWKQAAMRNVLLKLTGQEEIWNHPVIAAELRNSANYVSQFQTLQQDGRQLMRVQFDPSKITQLLQNQQIPIWGSRRPDVLIWLSEHALEQTNFVMEEQHPLRQALAAQAKLRGLSLVYPLFDANELAAVDISQLTLGDWTGLSVVASRYQADLVLHLHVTHQVDAAGQHQYKLVQQQLRGTEMVTTEFVANDWQRLAEQFAQPLASDFAKQYAVNTAAVVGSAAETLQLTIEGVQSLSDLVALQQLFGRMLAVKQFTVVEFKSPTVVLQFELAVNSAAFYQALALENQLVPRPAVAADTSPDLATNAALSTEPNPLLADTASSAADVAAAEAAMADALGLELPASPVAAETGVIATTSTPSTHYQFTRR